MILAWDNKVDAAALTVGSEIATLPGSNVKTAHLSQKWYTAAGVKSSNLVFDMAASTACSMLAVLGTNLTPTASARLRGSITDATGQTATTVDTGPIASVKTGYGMVYRHVRGTYTTVAGETPSWAADFTGGVATLLGSSGLTVTRAAATATRVNAAGLIEVVAADTPRFDYDPTTLACKGLLVETSRLNMLVRSCEFENAAWVISSAGTGVAPIIVANAGIAPDGTLTADRITLNKGAGNAGGDISNISQTAGAVVLGTVMSGSLYVKGPVGDKIAMRTSGGGVYKLHVFTGNWDRIKSTEVDTLAAAYLEFTCRGGEGTSSQTTFLAWGAQCEPGGHVSSVILTTGAATTRNSDLVTLPLGTFFNASEGTVYAEFDTNNVTAATKAVWSFIGAANHYIEHYMETVNARVIAASGGAGNVALVLGSDVTADAVRKSAVAYRRDDYAALINGNAVQTDAAATLPTLTTMGIGAFATGAEQLEGHVRRLSYFPTRLLNTQLQALISAPLSVDYQPSARYWRLELADAAVASNLQIGRVFIGPSWWHSDKLRFGWGITAVDPSEITKSRGGQSYPDAVAKSRMLEFTLDYGSEAEMFGNAFAMAMANGRVKDVLAIPFENGSYVSEQAAWGLVKASEPVVHRLTRTFMQKFAIEERL